MVSVEYSEAIVEVLDILEYSDDSIVKKIPKKLIEFWQRNQSTTYKPNLDHEKSIKEMELKDKTRAIIAMLYMNYLCDETEKNQIALTLEENEQTYQQKLRQKYKVDNMFENTRNTNIDDKIEQNNETHNELIVVEKEGFLEKIINKIKKWFGRN